MAYLKINPCIQECKSEELQFDDLVFHTNGLDMTIQTEKIVRTEKGKKAPFDIEKEFVYSELSLQNVREIHAFLGAYIAQKDYDLKEYVIDRNAEDTDKIVKAINNIQ